MAITVFIVVALFFGLPLFFGYNLVFRKTYDFKLENMYYIASTLGVCATLLAIWVAIRIPKKIAEQQNKIALFDKHHHIYNTYMESVRILNFDILEKYASLGLFDKIVLQIDKIIMMRNEIFIQYNKAKFLCEDDPVLLIKLKVIADKYIEVSNFYIEALPSYIEISNKAWKAVHEKFPDINNLQSLMQNEQATEIFKTHNTTPDSKHLDALINQYEKRFADENFDIHFKKYLTIK